MLFLSSLALSGLYQSQYGDSMETIKEAFEITLIIVGLVGFGFVFCRRSVSANSYVKPKI